MVMKQLLQILTNRKGLYYETIMKLICESIFSNTILEIDIDIELKLFLFFNFL